MTKPAPSFNWQLSAVDGDDAFTLADVPDRVCQRLLDGTRVDEGGCWIFRTTVPNKTHGYSELTWGKSGRDFQRVLIHRLAYVLWNGSIPGDLTVDHICHKRQCVRPDHLRLLTRSENSRDNGRRRKELA